MSLREEAHTLQWHPEPTHPACRKSSKTIKREHQPLVCTPSGMPHPRVPPALTGSAGQTLTGSPELFLQVCAGPQWHCSLMGGPQPREDLTQWSWPWRPSVLLPHWPSIPTGGPCSRPSLVSTETPPVARGLSLAQVDRQMNRWYSELGGQFSWGFCVDPLHTRPRDHLQESWPTAPELAPAGTGEAPPSM